jgi:sec-independent protein translocase protein TatA
MFGGRLGTGEIILILVVVILLFGAKKLPDTARALGRSMRILKSETKAMKDDDKTAESAAPEAKTDVPRTIQAAPGATAEARPVGEPGQTAR